GRAACAAAHGGVVAALSLDESGTSAAFAGADGGALARFFDDVAARGGLAVAAAHYGGLFEAAMSDRVVRRPGAPGARVRIYGPLEARLTRVDRVVLGGLVEGAWPPETRADPWLSRPMRHQLGL